VKFSGALGGVAENTTKVVNDINSAKNYPDNPLLLTNPSLLGDYAAGKKDGETAGALREMIKTTTDEIVRLQEAISAGGARTKEREELAAAGELLKTQFRAAVDYAGGVRSGDIGEGGAVKDLFDSIDEQMGGSNERNKQKYHPVPRVEQPEKGDRRCQGNLFADQATIE
jgi:hypothetical protein